MTTLKEALEETVESWDKLNYHAMLFRFVLRNGRPFNPVKRVGGMGKPNECFSNAARYVMRRSGIYVEGYAMRHDLGIPIHHAWVSLDGTDAMDPTMPSHEYSYFGVPFDKKVLLRELHKNKSYGLLDIGEGLNSRLMFRLDPELERIVGAIILRRHERYA